ncbi:hypothetical protein ACOMHN_052284 [Nucella lapillus]
MSKVLLERYSLCLPGSSNGPDTCSQPSNESAEEDNTGQSKRCDRRPCMEEPTLLASTDAHFDSQTSTPLSQGDTVVPAKRPKPEAPTTKEAEPVGMQCIKKPYRQQGLSYLNKN